MNINKVVAIHQPNFFPWLGYFDKIIRSDAFVFLDHVQFPKTGGVWTNRVKLSVSGKPQWVTAPIIRNYHGFLSINQMQFQIAVPWREKMLKTIMLNYSKAPYYKESFELFESLILNPENNISSYNTKAVIAICQQLDISKNKFYWSSQMSHSDSSNELLISLTKEIGGTTYMCGGGADGYQNEQIFKDKGVILRQQDFIHPPYKQTGISNFISGLSIIDAVMNIGWNGVKDLLEID